MGGFQEHPGEVRWRLHLSSPPEAVYDALATESGRATYWAERAPERDGAIDFHILNYPVFTGKVLSREPPRRFALEYFGTVVTFELEPDGEGGTDLSLVAEVPDESSRMEIADGWVSVLLAMKAAVNFEVDLRNHDAQRSWSQGYADN